VVVPQLEGKDVVAALQLLSDLELNTRVKGAEYNPQVPENYVLYQDPPAGTEIKKDRNVRLVLSKGTRTIAMPNLVGTPLRHARILLEESGLCSGVTAYGASQIVEKDSILAHYPPPGARVARERCVDLLVSSGPRPEAWKMPDLTGMPLDDALLQIDAAGLVPGEIRTRYEAGGKRNAVLNQDPAPGWRVPAGARVQIEVNRVSGEGRKIDGHAGIGLFRYRLPPGFLKRRIRIQLNAYGQAIDLIDEHIQPGQEVWALIPRHNDATVLLYEDDVLIRSEVFP
jgi:beta-lactam-binding protein with PASTA domain